MSAIIFIVQTFIWFSLSQAIIAQRTQLALPTISQESNKYCLLNSECELESHIGCHHSTLRSSGYEIEHLRYSDRLSILNYLNQFRSNVAIGDRRFRAESFPYMKKVLWNYEMEKLLKLSIRKMSNTRFPCILTSKSDQISQFYNILDKPKGSFTIQTTFSSLLSDIIKRAVDTYTTASVDDVIAYSYLFNPETSTIGCAIGSKVSSGSIKNVYIRCAFNGTKVDKNTLNTKIGSPCSACNLNNMNCDQFFPGLCVPGIIKGYRGDRGVDGLPGNLGPDGVKGDVGDKGDNGLIGLTGLKGQKGDIGMKGEKGSKEISGSKGDKGDRGVTVVGLPGPPGIRIAGVAGLPGPKGMRGSPGIKGNYSYSKGEKGDVVFGAPGDKGNKGNKGVRGDNGPIGPPGTKGVKGNSPLLTRAELSTECNKCPSGEKGEKGVKGSQGPKGRSVEHVN